MFLTFDKETNRFIAKVSFEERTIPKSSGFVWDTTLKRWVTDNPDVAEILAQFADGPAAARLCSLKENKRATLASKATDSGIHIPLPSQNLSLIPYQKAGVAYALERKDTLIADQMGLGKSIQAVAFCNCSPIRKILIVCPASLKVNWLREWVKWTVHNDLSVGHVGKLPEELVSTFPVRLVHGTDWPNTDVVVVNYDILHNHAGAIRAVLWDVLICDEAHALKTPDARRTQHVLGGGKGKKRVTPINAKSRLFLTGTPMTARPVDLWPICHAFDPTGLGKDWIAFTRRYCAAWDGPWGYDTSGASNLEELQEKLRSTFMVRRTKDQVLKDLPPKRRQIVELPADGVKRILEREVSLFNLHRYSLEQAPGIEDETFEEVAKKLDGPILTAINEMAAARQEVALAKLPMVIEFVNSIIESGQKVIVFCYHKSVAEGLEQAYPQAAVITGKVPPNKRQVQVDKFQNEPECNVFIGQIVAAGSGHTLTASSTVVFAELDWVPGTLSQCEDRAHRIGQTAESVNVYHLVLQNSLDAQMVHSLVDKQENIDKALDN